MVNGKPDRSEIQREQDHNELECIPADPVDLRTLTQSFCMRRLH
jgi:hypothetical protein